MKQKTTVLLARHSLATRVPPRPSVPPLRATTGLQGTVWDGRAHTTIDHRTQHYTKINLKRR